MNTTDDGQPVGEDVPVGFQLMGTAHLGNPVSSMLAAADLITARTLAVEEIREAARFAHGGAVDSRDILGILERHGLC